MLNFDRYFIIKKKLASTYYGKRNKQIIHKLSKDLLDDLNYIRVTQSYYPWNNSKKLNNERLVVLVDQCKFKYTDELVQPLFSDILEYYSNN